MKDFLIQNYGITTANMEILTKEVKGEAIYRISCFDLAVDKDCTLEINNREIKVFASYGISVSNMIINSLIIKESGIRFRFMGGVDLRYA